MKCANCGQPPIDNPGHLLIRSARMLRRSVGRRFKHADFSLTAEYWGLLNMLIHHEGINQTVLADFMGKDKPNLTRLLDRLEEKGFALRETDPEDRRSYRLHVTDDGRAVVERMRPEIEAHVEDVFAGIGKRDVDTFKKVLQTILRRMETMDEAACDCGGSPPRKVGS